MKVGFLELNVSFLLQKENEAKVKFLTKESIFNISFRNQVIDT
jgi:hypothetical protein